MNLRRFASLYALAGLFLLLVVLKHAALRQPYHWDVLGYVAPNALAVYERGFWLIPRGEFTGHPPVFTLALAGLWKLFGMRLLVSHLFVLAIASAGLFATYRLGEHLYGCAVGLAAAALLLFNQIFFAQIGTLNLPTALLALGVGAAYFYLREKRAGYLALGTLLVLVHEAAAPFIAAFSLHYAVRALARRTPLREAVRRGWWVPLPIVALLCWLLFHARAVGWAFHTEILWNRDVFWSTLGLNFVRHFFHDRTSDDVNKWNWLLSAAILTYALVRLRRERLRWRPGSAALLFLSIVVLHVVLFSYTDDLPRYFLPILPFYYLAAAHALDRLLRRPAALLAATAAVSALFTLNYHGHRNNPGWQLESNLEYVDMIENHVEAARYLEREHAGKRIVTCFPMSVELREPRYGYVSRRLDVTTDYDLADTQSVLLYESPQSSCPFAGEFQSLKRHAVQLARFEKDGKSAVIYSWNRRPDPIRMVVPVQPLGITVH